MLLQLIIKENRELQIFNLIKQVAKNNGYEVVESYMHELGYDNSLTYSIYKKRAWYILFFSKPTLHFNYVFGEMDIFDVNENNFNSIMQLVNMLFKNIDGLTIKINKNFID